MGYFAEGEHLSMQAVAERGWTRALIRDFLGEPDKCVENPHYRTAAPCKLYALERIERAEENPDFRKRMDRILERRPDRKRAAQVRADRKRQDLFNLVDSTPIRISGTGRLLSRAISHFNHFRRYHPSGDLRPDFVPATRDSDPEFLHRITCNYVRHGLTNYDQFLYSSVRSRVGCEEAYRRFRQRIDDSVLEYVSEHLKLDREPASPGKDSGRDSSNGGGAGQK